MSNSKKPLGEWTLAEVKAECEKYQLCDPKCAAYTYEYGSAVRCRLRFAPTTWGLTEPSRWTEQDRKDAHTISSILSSTNSVTISRLPSGALLLSDNYASLKLYRNLFPSLKPNESVELDKILGEADK